MWQHSLSLHLAREAENIYCLASTERFPNLDLYQQWRLMVKVTGEGLMAIEGVALSSPKDQRLVSQQLP